MNIYRYDPCRNLSHLEDHGDLDTAPDEFFDGGNLEPDNRGEEKDTDILDISNEEVVRSCSLFKVRGESKAIVKVSVFSNHEDLNTDDIVYCGIILTWIGFGTSFELNNGSERIISPYLNSGTAR
jgi:hypothetical protein